MKVVLKHHPHRQGGQPPHWQWRVTSDNGHWVLGRGKAASYNEARADGLRCLRRHFVIARDGEHRFTHRVAMDLVLDKLDRLIRKTT